MQLAINYLGHAALVASLRPLYGPLGGREWSSSAPEQLRGDFAPCRASALCPWQINRLGPSSSRPPHQHRAGTFAARASHVPLRSLNRARVTSAPEADRPGIQAPAGLVPDTNWTPGLLAFAFSARI